VKPDHRLPFDNDLSVERFEKDEEVKKEDG
jgi:hypothetical protein